MVNRKIISAIPFLLFSIAIYIVSSIEGPELPELGFELSDKLLHITVFFFYGITITFFVQNNFPSLISKKQIIIIFLIGTFYAITDEFHQNFVIGRDCNFFDFLADVIGIIISLLLFKNIQKISISFFK